MSPIERSGGGGGSGFTNPMTTKGDIIIESAVPAPARLAIGAAGQFLGISGGLPAWAGISIATLFDSTLGADAAAIDTGAGGIAQTSAQLLVYFLARTDVAAVLDSATFTVNNDTGANYDRQTFRASNVTVTATNVLASTGWSVAAFGNTAGAGQFAAGIFLLPAYTQTTALKAGVILTAQLDATAGNCRMEGNALSWRSTAAITRMAMTHGGGTVLKAGSRLSIYGVG